MDVLRQMFSVLLVFALLGGMLWALRRSGRVSLPGFTVKGLARKRVLGNARAMVALERLALTPTHTLHVVRVNGREVLFATHPQGCSVVPMVKERAMGAEA